MEKISNTGEAPSIKAPIDYPNSAECETDKESKLKILFNDQTICFNVTKTTLPPKDYQAIFTLDQLYKVNKYFLNFESANDLVNGVINTLKQKTSNIKFIDNKCIIQMVNPITNKSFEINLNPKEKDLSTRVSSLETYIAEQNKKILNLETYIDEQNKKMIKMEERIKSLEDIIFEYKKEKKEKEKEKEEEANKIFLGSQIITKESKDMLLNWLPRKPNKITLLMNSNIDGDSTKTFMDKCNGKCPTLAVIKTTNGYVFGGYTTQMWKEGKVKDNNAFVFSINKKRKYNIKQPENAIGFGKNLCWLFGDGYNAILVYENCTKKNSNFVGNGTYDIPERYELNGGEQKFTVKSFEIYHIEY
jgi:uncharacterized coiled-coil protein SlyX